MVWVWTALGVVLALFLASLTPAGRDFRRRMMARMYDRTMRRYEARIGDRKRALFAALSGTVLEIGPGTGANFEFLPAAVTRWIGVEPNPHMHASLRAAAERQGIAAEFRSATTDAMAVDDASVDCVLSTLVLCSVPDPTAVARDVERVLRPGGKFVFIEHVGAPRGSTLRFFQSLVRPFWAYFADGCCPNRDLEQAIRDVGFASISVERFRIDREAGPAIIAPHIAGVAGKG
ncbi:MAG: class I SAM-dependent methyltransferase [Planctomycetes bacterium]|nr:class I SAM-dependent methyltransferase [Planctomycetota bacterium]